MMRKAFSFLLAIALVGCQLETSSLTPGQGSDQSTKKPTADFTVQVSERLVTVDGSASRGNGDQLSYQWNFNNEAPLTGVNASYEFSSDGTKTITLVVTEKGVKSEPVTKQVTVTGSTTSTNEKPIASFNVTTAGLTVHLDAGDSTDADNDALVYLWSLNGEATRNGETLSYTFDSAGEKTISLMVNDGTVNSDTVTKTITLAAVQTNTAPVAQFNLATNDLMVRVDGSSSTDADNDTLTYRWDFNGEATATGKTAQHTFSQEGTKTIRLTVNDGTVDSSVLEKKITVTAPVMNTAPVAKFSVVTDDLTVKVNGGDSSDAENDALTYRWDFNGEATALGQTAEYTFAAEGTKSIRLTVNDGMVNSLTVEKTVQVVKANTSPVASFTFSVSDLTVIVDGSGSTDADNDTITYVWTFDGNTQPESVSATAQFTFDSAGSKTVSLVVNDGSVNSAIVTKAVAVTEPTIDYSAALTAVAAQMPSASCTVCHGATLFPGATISYGTGSEEDIKAGLSSYLSNNLGEIETVKSKPTGGVSHTGAKPFENDPIQTHWMTLVDGIAQELTAPKAGDSPALIVEDYENQTVGSVPQGWGINKQYSEYSGADAQQHSDIIRVVDTVAHSGTKALLVNGVNDNKRYVFQNVALPSNGQRLFVRYYVRSSKALGNRADQSVNHNHFMAISNGDVYNEQEVRIGEMKGALGVNESVSDALAPKYEYWWGKIATPQMKADTWYCVENAFLNGGDKSELRTWLDGELITEITEPTDFHSTVVDKWLDGRFKRVNFGWASWGTYDNDIYFDDIVVSTERVGCL